MAAKKTVKNVPIVDKKKALDRDLGVEMEREAEAVVEELAAKDAAEKEQSKLIQKFMEEEEQLKLNRKPQNIPGHIEAWDPTHIPEYVRTTSGSQRRVVDPEYVYRWVRHVGNAPSKMSSAHAKGYRAVFYDDTFKGTELSDQFQRYGSEGWVLNGDCILMKINRKRFAELTARKKKIADLWSRTSTEKFRDVSKRLGVEAYREDAVTGRKELL